MLLIKLLLFIVAVALLAGCVSYRHTFFAPKFKANLGYDLHAIEVDDYGVFWNPAAAQAQAKVHGWPDTRSVEERFPLSRGFQPTHVGS